VRGDVGGDLQLSALRAPVKGGAEVAELGLDPVDRVAPPRSVPSLPARRGLTAEVRRVPIAHPRQAAGLGQPVLAELPNRLVQPIARALAAVLGDDQRLADQRVEPGEDVDVVEADDRRDARQVEPSREHRGVAHQRLLFCIEQVV
jgi:hypothetical protein